LRDFYAEVGVQGISHDTIGFLLVCLSEVAPEGIIQRPVACERNIVSLFDRIQVMRAYLILQSDLAPLPDGFSLFQSA